MPPAPQILVVVADFVLLTTIAGLCLALLMRGRVGIRGAMSGQSAAVAGVLLTVLVYGLGYMASHPAADPNLANEFAGVTRGWIPWAISRSGLLLVAVGLAMADRRREKAERRVTDSEATQRQLEIRAMQAEERFRNLFDTSSGAVYCYEFDPPIDIATLPEDQARHMLDGVLTECNEAFAAAVGIGTPAQVLGTRLSLLDSSKDRQSHTRICRDLISNGYRLRDYEFIYRDAAGDDCAISVSLTGIVRDGLLERLWGVEQDIVEMRRTKSELFRRRVFDEMLAGISSRLVVTRTPESDGAMLTSLKEVCELLGGNRIFLVWGDEGRRTGEILYAWQADGRPLLNEVRFELFPFLGEKLLQNEAFAVADVDQMPDEAGAEKRTLQSVGIKSFMIVPLIVTDRVAGFTGIANDQRHCNWSQQDVLNMRVVSELFASYVLRLRQRRALDKALENLQAAKLKLEAENVYLRAELKISGEFVEIIGESKPLRRCLQMVEAVAATSTPVLLLGETGTGKELVARALHRHSDRKDRRLVKVNCAALPANLIESELFGYEKGAFTGADSSKTGRFQQAHGGTIFLDEIAEIPIELQAKLLRVLQDGEFDRLGASKSTRVDVRIVAATNRDLRQACDAGEFREDLLYRINAYPIELPPLRERGRDIRLLAEHFAHKHAARLGRNVAAISADMMRQLEAYDWPGNVRELEGAIQRALISTTGPVLDLGYQLVDSTDDIGFSGGDIRTGELRLVERRHILSVLEAANWKISGGGGAAAILGIPPSTLRSKMKKHGIARPAQT